MKALAPSLAAAAPVIDCIVDRNECGPATADETLRGDFCFVGEHHRLGERFNWRANPSRDMEWLILLHKFYYAPCLVEKAAQSGDLRYFDRWTELTASWVEAGIEPGFIAADVTGRRIQNWVYAYHGAAHAGLLRHAPQGFEAAFIDSIDAQTAWLCDNLHASRNHRTLELYAILLSAFGFPGLPQSARRRSFAIAALEDNALADFRGDGGHCEQSTHYHCIVLRNFLNAVALMKNNDVAPPPAMLARLDRAKTFARAVHRPDGEIAALSDADGGSYLEMLDEPAPSRPVLFPESGYAVFAGGPGRDSSWLIFDCGPLGEGNHGHFDAHSIELFGRGAPLIVDPGRFTYDESGETNWRAAFRSTAAHSTVEIDGRNQTRYAPGKRKMKVAGPAPRASVLAFEATPGGAYIHSRLVSDEYPAVHHRRILFVNADYFVVVDDMLSTDTHDCRLRWQLSPEPSDGASLAPDGDSVRFSSPRLSIVTSCSATADATLEAAFVSRRYGEKTPADRLCIAARGARVQFVTVLSPRSAGEPEPFVAVLRQQGLALLHIRGSKGSEDILVPAIDERGATAPMKIGNREPRE